MSKFIIILLLFFLILLTLANLGLLIYLIMRARGTVNAAKNVPENMLFSSVQQNNQKEIIDAFACEKGQDFLSSSAQHALKVLAGKIAIMNSTNYSENKKVINAINDMDMANKKLTAMAITDIARKNNESWLRGMAAQYNTPLWFIILREAVQSVVPDFGIAPNNYSNKIVPLHQQSA